MASIVHPFPGPVPTSSAGASGAPPPLTDDTAPGRDQRTVKGEATRARLLAEAMRLFAERGYHGVSTRALAEAAASNVALITFHFGSKRGLYEAAIEAVEHRLAEVVHPVVAALRREVAARDPDPAEIMGMVRTLIRRLLAQLLPATPTPGFFQLLSREMQEQGPLSERLWRLFLPVLGSLEEVLVAASSPALRAKARMASFLLVVSLLGVVRDYDAFRRHLPDARDQAADAEALADLLCAGLPDQFPARAETSPSRSVPC